MDMHSLTAEEYPLPVLMLSAMAVRDLWVRLEKIGDKVLLHLRLNLALNLYNKVFQVVIPIRQQHVSYNP